MDIATIAAEWWLKWAFGILGAALVAGYRSIRKKQKQQEDRQKALENGVQAILRRDIVEAYYKYHERGNITLHGLENVNSMFKAYAALGGNGTAKHLVEAMREMEVMDE